jgi:hypothetical protein
MRGFRVLQISFIPTLPMLQTTFLGLETQTTFLLLSDVLVVCLSKLFVSFGQCKSCISYQGYCIQTEEGILLNKPKQVKG